MCGLTGFARHPTKGAPLATLVPILETMLITSQHRGEHATGLALGAGKTALTWKKAVDASTALRSASWHTFIETAPATTSIAMGHVRHATEDNAHEDYAAHPFTFGKITGVHNGIIRNWKTLATKYGPRDPDSVAFPGVAPWTVDSEAAFDLIDRLGAQAAVEQLGGYFSLAWMRSGGEHLFFARDTAPLMTVYVPQWRTLFWASEASILLRALTVALDGAPVPPILPTAASILYHFEPKTFAATDPIARRTPLTLKPVLPATTTTPVTGTSLTRTWRQGAQQPKATVKRFAQSSLWDARTARETAEPGMVEQRLLKRIARLEADMAAQQAETEYLFSILREAGYFEGEPDLPTAGSG